MALYVSIYIYDETDSFQRNLIHNYIEYIPYTINLNIIY